MTGLDMLSRILAIVHLERCKKCCMGASEIQLLSSHWYSISDNLGAMMELKKGELSIWYVTQLIFCRFGSSTISRCVPGVWGPLGSSMPWNLENERLDRLGVFVSSSSKSSMLQSIMTIRS